MRWRVCPDENETSASDAARLRHPVLLLHVPAHRVYGRVPVSYTHLDVYKRQAQYGVQSAENGSLILVSGEKSAVLAASDLYDYDYSDYYTTRCV